MTTALALYTIKQLAALSVEERDRRLCAMHSGHWLALADALGISLPLHGGDAPKILGAAIAGRTPS
ncbi:MAG: hypothetical protein EOS65_02480 [Mesorhizobium sp.]|uniref:hypothetical protein n=1 Tax=Mesorhizobium sp. TaxID=1871066 RepID=UPI000FE73587|nr:hypothetical protein [Mesorhizobium sp.]RWF44262.1 MAG: hypothetical protein EOS65_02480 [Mesorhizobium sp.]